MADEACERLDELTLNFFDKFEQIQAKREEICKIMKDGYLNLSQARYSMGNKSVCPLQYSEKMKASTFVSLNDNDGLAFEIVNFKAEDCTKDVKEEQSGSVRKRKVDKKPENENIDGSNSVKDLHVDDTEDLTLQELSLKDRKQADDPLKWFGVLVPVCLRTGQAQFRKAIDLCCELVNLENEIKTLMEKYRSQKKLKIKQKDEQSKDC